MAVYTVRSANGESFLIHRDAGRFRVAGTKGLPRACFAREADLRREIFRLVEERDRLRDVVDQLGKSGLDVDDVFATEPDPGRHQEAEDHEALPYEGERT